MAGSRSSTTSHVGKGVLRAIFWVSFSHSRKNKVVALDLLPFFSLTKKKKVREPLRPHLPGPADGVTNAVLAANLGLETCV